MGLLGFIDEMKPYVEKLSSLSFQEIRRILGAYGMAAIRELVDFPDEGQGVMTKSLYAERKIICAGCPLKTPANTCDPNKSRPHKTLLAECGAPLMVNGCSCGLWAKQKSFDDHCPAGEW